MPSLNVLSVASEVCPRIKIGGLADVAGALPAALGPEAGMTTDASWRGPGRRTAALYRNLVAGTATSAGAP